MAAPRDYQGNSSLGDPYRIASRSVSMPPLTPVGAALDVQTNAKRVPQAELALKALVGEIQTLHTDVSTLLGRLTPVLRPEPPTKEPDATGRPITGAPLIDGIHDQVALLVRLRGVVHSALDRLEV